MGYLRSSYLADFDVELDECRKRCDGCVRSYHHVGEIAARIYSDTWSGQYLALFLPASFIGKRARQVVHEDMHLCCAWQQQLISATLGLGLE